MQFSVSFFLVLKVCECVVCAEEVECAFVEFFVFVDEHAYNFVEDVVGVDERYQLFAFGVSPHGRFHCGCA